MSVRFPTPDKKTPPTPPPDLARGRNCPGCYHVGAMGNLMVCKCYPPVLAPGGGWVWPGVEATDWCGQFRPISGG